MGPRPVDMDGLKAAIAEEERLAKMTKAEIEAEQDAVLLRTWINWLNSGRIKLSVRKIRNFQ